MGISANLPIEVAVSYCCSIFQCLGRQARVIESLSVWSPYRFRSCSRHEIEETPDPYINSLTLNTHACCAERVLAVAPVCMHAPSIDMMSTLSMSRVIRSGKINTYLRVLGEHIISCRSS